MTSALFSPFAIGEMTVPNRIAVAPMCQYSADDGSATDWHLQHWMMLAMSGAGMITIEATGVERHGRITHGCLGLYSDHNEAAAQRALAAARRVAPHGTRFGIQLAHAGRKASTHLPWQGGGPLRPAEDPWQTVGPSAVPYAPDWHEPAALDESGIQRVITAFANAAERAVRAGFDFVEVHGAHGYLIHSFLSPVANKRTDHWGGSLENRMRLALAVAKAVRAVVPASMPVGARLSATDWVEGGFDIDEAVVVVAGPQGGRHRVRVRIERRRRLSGQGAQHARLPGALRGPDPRRGRNSDAGRRPHRRSPSGRGDRRRGQGRSGRPCPRDARRPALAMARRGRPGGAAASGRAICPLGFVDRQVGRDARLNLLQAPGIA